MTDQASFEFLKSIELFAVFSDTELKALAASSETLNFDLGDTIYASGDIPAGLCIVQKGRARLFVEEHGKETSHGIRKTGDVFAEIAALRNEPLEFSVRSSGKTQLVVIPRSALNKALENNPEAKKFIGSYVAITSAGGFVSRLFDLKNKLSNEELEKLIDSVGIKRVAAGNVILAQDSREDHRLYVVRQGEVSIERKDQGDEFHLATLKKGEIFGEKACLTRQEQQATAKAVTDSVILIIPE